MSSYEDTLRPFLEPGGANEKGEIGMSCPMHQPDVKRSASVNFLRGMYYCQVCEIGGPIGELAKFVTDNGIKREGGSSYGGSVDTSDAKPLPSSATIAGWQSALVSHPTAAKELLDRKGLNEETLKRFQLGWDAGAAKGAGAYTIPIYDDEAELVNVRWYQFDPEDERRKIWSITGRGSPTLFPIDQLEDQGSIIVCEGEWDAMLTIQHGFRAVTRTGAADVWKQEWNPSFRGRQVYVCHDMDAKGLRANLKVATELSKVSEEVYVIELPYEVVQKHGKDLSDYWMDGYSEDEFEEMVESFEPFLEGRVEDEPEEIGDIRLIDTFSSDHFGVPLRAKVTVTGRRSITYGAPELISFSCNQDAGIKCATCKMNSNGYDGAHDEYIAPDEQAILEMVDVPTTSVAEVLRKRLGAPKCGMLRTEVTKYHSVEEIYVRPEIDSYRMTYESSDYQTRKIISVGRHNTMPNITVEVVGKTFPHPKDQANTFLASQVRKTITSIDNFELTPEMAERLQVFQTISNPLRKCVEIARDMARNVTHIYGRDEMHVLFDLAVHSAIGFEFEGRRELKGWLDVIILGDTRTGKSEVSLRLLNHYGVGEMVSCEAASFAGVVGGLEQHAGREWVVRWGAIPINDRRLVALDEVSGLSFEEIGRMSSIRSSGVAELTKIQSERTFARTRLVWMGNPRRSSMAHYTYGVLGIPKLIGNNEDVARFDLAMTVASGDVASSLINADHVTEDQGTKYPADLCHALALWVWSRKPFQVYWQSGSQDLVRQAAMELGEMYVDNPPLVQKENVRIKIARIAVAIAGRTFSTFDGEHLEVTASHVESAVSFINRLYNMQGFGYGELSKEYIEEQKEAEGNAEDARVYLHNHVGLAKFLRTVGGGFRNQDLMDTLNMTREMAAAVSSSLWSLRMIRREGPEMRINPVMQRLLREVKD